MSFWAASAWLLVGGLCVACQAAPADLREWQPSDHGHSEGSGAERKGQTTAAAKPRVAGLDEVTLSTWQNHCVTCHGQLGHGDGPQAPMYKPRDLADPNWQASISDAQILDAIQNGKGKMPGFALPRSTADGLVKLVRMLGGAKTGSEEEQRAAPGDRPDTPPPAKSSDKPQGSTSGQPATSGTAR